MPLTARNFNHKGNVFVITTYQQIHKQNVGIYGISIYVETASLQINKQLDPSPAIRIVWPKLRLVLLPSCAALANFFLQRSEKFYCRVRF